MKTRIYQGIVGARNKINKVLDKMSNLYFNKDMNYDPYHPNAKVPTMPDNATSPTPRPEDFGYDAMDGFGEHGSGGWQFEGGEEAYDAAMAVWEKANVCRSSRK